MYGGLGLGKRVNPIGKMASGIVVDKEVLVEYHNMKFGKSYKYMVMRVNQEKTNIVVEEVVPNEPIWGHDRDVFNELTEKLHCIDDARYMVFDFCSDLPRACLVFLYWCPEALDIEQKYTYASSLEVLKGSLEGITHFVQANDYDDLDYDVIYVDVLEKVKL